MDIVNVSRPNTTVPACLKTATIILLPMQSNITSLNNYRLAALISIIFKCFENLILEQYAYWSNRSTGDTIISALCIALNHLGWKGTYVRMLFVDYSTANTTVRSRLVTKMLDLLATNCRSRTSSGITHRQWDWAPTSTLKLLNRKHNNNYPEAQMESTKYWI